MARWIYVYYKCTNSKCSNTDRDTRLEDDNTPPLLAVQCTVCGSGKGLTEEQMLGAAKGMRPLSQPPEGRFANSWEENQAYYDKQVPAPVATA